ncbi:High mobility group protein 20A [Sphaceloma murrayae]|uniref:High mobility group protein 20A n=1 Tax=Sphaceloma murrayae TaxID=2082308 RepID=A0A2K1QT70_9PEZI|nr:High mobility group protein 20A [Sphaceloma murrayae]
MKDRLPQMLRKTQRYTTLEVLGIEKDTIPWYWRVAAGISSWLIVGGFLMLPATFDNSDGFKVSKTAIASLGIALSASGVGASLVLLVIVRNPIFVADTILPRAFTSSLMGLLTALYSFLVQRRYVWNLAAILTVTFAACLTMTYGVLLFYTQRRIAACKGHGKPQHIPLRSHTSYEDARTAYEPSIHSQHPLPTNPATPHEPVPDTRQREETFYNNYLNNLYPMLGSPSNTGAPVTAAPQTPGTPWDAQSVVSERPPPPPINRPPPDASMLTEEELTRQQMLMLLLNRPEPARPVDPSGQPLRSETSYHIDWSGDEIQTPIVGPDHSRTTSIPAATIPQRTLPSGPAMSPPMNLRPQTEAITPARPHHSHTRSTSSSKAIEAGMPANEAPGVPPPYGKHWDGVWRSTADIPQDRLHPAFRESRFLHTGGVREARRREIERQGSG